MKVLKYRSGAEYHFVRKSGWAPSDEYHLINFCVEFFCSPNYMYRMDMKHEKVEVYSRKKHEKTQCQKCFTIARSEHQSRLRASQKVTYASNDSVRIPTDPHQ